MLGRGNALRRRRRDVGVYEEVSSGSLSGGLTSSSCESDGGERPHKQRRSGVGVDVGGGGSGSGSSSGGGGGGGRGGGKLSVVQLLQTPEDRGGRLVPMVGDRHQADVPAKPSYDSQWPERAPPIESALVYAPEQFNATATTTYLQSLNADARRRNGFDLAPFARELALMQLHAAHGDVRKATTATNAVLSRCSSAPYYPGLRRVQAVSRDEHCRFVRALGEHGKDFYHMARAFPNRSRAQLVWLYYARHKQWRLQNGCVDSALVLDNGASDALKTCPLSTTRAVLMLHALARSADDGFVTDQRLVKMILAARTRAVAQERRRRDGENGRRGTRTRP